MFGRVNSKSIFNLGLCGCKPAKSQVTSVIVWIKSDATLFFSHNQQRRMGHLKYKGKNYTNKIYEARIFLFEAEYQAMKNGGRETIREALQFLYLLS